jgi:hypothetical protein
MATIQQIAKAIKKLGNQDSLPSVPAVARELGEDLNGSFVSDVYEAEPVAFPGLKLPATKNGVKQGRNANLRFERIAARTGLSVAEVKEMAEDVGMGQGHYIGRGRRGNGNGGGAKPKASSGRRSGVKVTKDEGKGTSGRRGRGKAAAAPAQKVRGRRGTRASANPK